MRPKPLAADQRTTVSASPRQPSRRPTTSSTSSGTSSPPRPRPTAWPPGACCWGGWALPARTRMRFGACG